MGTINVLQLRSGRVFHAGGCSGIHNSAPSCDGGLEVYLQQLQRLEALEFPSAVLGPPHTVTWAVRVYQFNDILAGCRFCSSMYWSGMLLVACISLV
jgi:hypothetical protein